MFKQCDFLLNLSPIMNSPLAVFCWASQWAACDMFLYNMVFSDQNKFPSELLGCVKRFKLWSRSLPMIQSLLSPATSSVSTAGYVLTTFSLSSSCCCCQCVFTPVTACLTFTEMCGGESTVTHLKSEVNEMSQALFFPGKEQVQFSWTSELICILDLWFPHFFPSFNLIHLSRLESSESHETQQGTNKSDPQG